MGEAVAGDVHQLLPLIARLPERVVDHHAQAPVRLRDELALHRVTAGVHERKKAGSHLVQERCGVHTGPGVQRPRVAGEPGPPQKTVKSQGISPPPSPKRSGAQRAHRIPELLTREPQALPVRSAVARVPVPEPVWGAGPEERLAANAKWCRTCQALVDAPTGAAGGPWILLHRSEPGRGLSTWTYPTEKEALHHGAHLAMTYLQLDDGPLDRVALDLFIGQVHAQVLARLLELRPETTQFEVAEVVPMRAGQF
ncbi:hypothetical protein [Streptomyces sp. NBC_01363]|uniref:hypothetical protein n=1 Tax=Streptomyces sp. NBC_01363 TaxID=2903840 RepID=UPI002253E04F|nr:hypothetical protein [Streptomyces sp. NBC_01363]MCX4734419.1 hypothetical protein [Streptomyces sp. NBC_01363]